MRFKTSTLAQVLMFVSATGLMVALVGLTFSQVRIEDNRTYKAEFSDASGLENNVDVRGSGVAVGSVRKIELRPAGGVLVTFTVPKDLAMTTATEARIRYANLTGDRYLELTPGAGAEAAPRIAPDSTIPETRTQPALELDDLFAGFTPLLRALSPEDVNELTSNIIGVTQGQSGAVESMLANVGSFTSGLAERDTLIGDVITDLSQTLATVDERKTDVTQLIDGLAGLTDKLADDRVVFTQSLGQLADLGDQVADFLAAVRPGLKANVDNLATASQNLNNEEAYMREILGDLKGAVNKVGRFGTNGGFFNFFLCGLRVQIDVPGSNDIQVPGVYAKNARCQHDGGN